MVIQPSPHDNAGVRLMAIAVYARASTVMSLMMAADTLHAVDSEPRGDIGAAVAAALGAAAARLRRGGLPEDEISQCLRSAMALTEVPFLEATQTAVKAGVTRVSTAAASVRDISVDPLKSLVTACWYASQARAWADRASAAATGPDGSPVSAVDAFAVSAEDAVAAAAAASARAAVMSERGESEFGSDEAWAGRWEESTAALLSGRLQPLERTAAGAETPTQKAQRLLMSARLTFEAASTARYTEHLLDAADAAVSGNDPGDPPVTVTGIDIAAAVSCAWDWLSAALQVEDPETTAAVVAGGGTVWEDGLLEAAQQVAGPNNHLSAAVHGPDHDAAVAFALAVGQEAMSDITSQYAVPVSWPAAQPAALVECQQMWSRRFGATQQSHAMHRRQQALLAA